MTNALAALLAAILAGGASVVLNQADAWGMAGAVIFGALTGFCLSVAIRDESNRSVAGGAAIITLLATVLSMFSNSH